MNKARVKKLREMLGEKQIRAAFIQKPKNILYYTGGFCQQNALLVIFANTSLLFIAQSDWSNKLEVDGEIVCYQDYDLFQSPQSLNTLLAQKTEIWKRINNQESIGLDGDCFPLGLHELPNRVSVQDISFAIMEQQSIKDREEVVTIIENIRILELALKRVQEKLKEDIVTEKELFQVTIESISQSIGAPFLWEGCLGSGERTDYSDVLPTERKINEGDQILVDLFPRLQNYYYGDITRTFFKGNISAQQEEIYEILKKALDAAEDCLRPGQPAAAVDEAVRQVISKNGFGEYFNHHSGHGLGLDCPGLPLLIPRSKELIKEGNVICVEPGIYIPSWGGMRIEQVYLIKKEGPTPLSRFPY